MANEVVLGLEAPTLSIEGAIRVEGVSFVFDSMPIITATGAATNNGLVIWQAPAFELEITGVGAAAVVLDSPLPTLTITGAVAQDIAVAMVLPMPTLVISATVNNLAHVAFVMPAPVMASTEVVGGDAELTAPFPTFVATGTPGVIGGIDVDLALPVIAATGSAGAVGSVEFEMPAPSMRAGAPAGVVFELPAPVMVVTGRVGIIGSVALRAQPFELAISATPVYTGRVALTPAVPRLIMAGTVGSVARVGMTLRSIALAADGYTGVVGTASMMLPMMEMDVHGYAQHIGDVILSVPMLQLAAVGQVSAGAAAVFTTMAMHTETTALTSYDNYDFNSFALFNGVYLGAKDDGIFALSGATDNGVLIQAAARLGLTDFGTSHLKRIDKCYMGYRADGNMVLRVTTDELTERDYLVRATGKSGLHGNHVDIGKGVKARYWQYEIRNKDGSDFSLDVIELKPTILRRRVGGGDA